MPSPIVETDRAPAIPGGRYTAQENADGTWNVFDVAIMGEMPKETRGNSFDVGRDWQEKAVAYHEMKYREDSYLPPLHVHHHSLFSDKTRGAGKFLLRRVAQKRYEGREMSTLFADLLQIPADVFDAIERGELPYRSIEIADWDKPEIT